ncbi:MAG: deoxyribonuclease IV [Candidatus Krumholzibacteria bacterium]|jgi:deoxyribonuclease-4|nr:deoxyribonuclease IV [Candidatus Krumholzibacteria bacterium]
MNLGAHMSISDGVHLALERGKSVGCNAVQLFVKSSNQWRAKPLTGAETSLFREKAKLYNPDFIVAHSSYLINIASPEKELLEKSRDALLVEVERCEELGIPWLVLHPGSHRGAGEEAGIAAVAESLDLVFQRTKGYRNAILLETTAGQGQTLGRTFEELAAMRERVKDVERVGYCYDTCHTFSAGYDISTKAKYESVFSALDGTLGLPNLKAFHLNDSKTPFDSRKDRHEMIGKGEIGIEPFRMLVNDARFTKIPMILETPKGPDLREDVENLALLRSLRKKGR